MGAPSFEGAGEASGAIIVYSGHEIYRAYQEGSDLADAQIALIDGGAAEVALGTAFDGPGDLDGDLIDDLALGAPAIEDSKGMIAIFYGPFLASATLEDADYTVVGDFARTRLGHAVSGVGDANGLGRADILYSSLENASEVTTSGDGYVYLLASDGL